MNEHAFWIIAIASLVGVSCSLVGVFLVLRRLAMVGDAISHAVLFGIASAFLLAGSRSPFVMLIGATAVGLLTVFITNVLNSWGKLQEDASIGVTFTWLFALGVILISAFAGQVDLDQECVLYGEIAFAPFDVLTIGGVEWGPRSFWMLALVLLVNLTFVALFYQKLKTVTFDPILARCLGINVTLWHYLLMTLVSLTVVAAFESVGAILVVAMLVVPANAAILSCRSIARILVVATGISLAASVGGYYLAAATDTAIAAAIALVAGGFFLFVLCFVGERSVLTVCRNRLRRGQAVSPISLGASSD